MSNIVVYDPNGIVANRVIQYLQSADTPAYTGNPNTLINPDLTSVSNVNYLYWKYDSPNIVEMTSQEKTDIDNFLSLPIVDIVSILEENIDENKRTGGNFRAKTLAFDVPTGQQWHYTNFSFPYPISLLSMEYVGVNSLINDHIKVDIAPDTTVGSITSDVSVSDNIIFVSQTVIDNVKVGYKITIDDGINNEDLGYIVEIDKVNKSISVENAVINSYLANTPTLIKQTIPIIDDIEIDYTTASITIGATKIGGSYLPANTVIRFGYYNGDGSASKRFRSILEYLY